MKWSRFYLACYNSDQNVGKSSPAPWKVSLTLVSFETRNSEKPTKDMPLFSYSRAYFIPGFLKVRVI